MKRVITSMLFGLALNAAVANNTVYANLGWGLVLGSAYGDSPGGIVVDNQLRTSAPDIHALGDCAEAQGTVVLYVMPLMEQARTLAKVLVGTEAELSYPVMPVVIKTPACPVTVCPPAPGTAGEWQVESSPVGVRALFLDGTDRLHGFALTGQATAEKNSLAQQLG